MLMGFLVNDVSTYFIVSKHMHLLSSYSLQDSTASEPFFPNPTCKKLCK